MKRAEMLLVVFLLAIFLLGMAVGILLIDCSEAAAQDTVGIRIRWLRSSDHQIVSEYLPYVCRGACDYDDEWLVETDAVGNRVRFDARESCPGLEGWVEQGDEACVATYRTTWRIGDTWSWTLAAVTYDGRQSEMSNVITETRTATTTTLPPVIRAPIIQAVEILP